MHGEKEERREIEDEKKEFMLKKPEGSELEKTGYAVEILSNGDKYEGDFIKG